MPMAPTMVRCGVVGVWFVNQSSERWNDHREGTGGGGSSKWWDYRG